MKTKLTLLSMLVLLSCITYGQSISIYRSGSLISPIYTSIDTAMAATMDGDSVVLSPDLFEGPPIVIDKSIILCGTIISPSSRTILKWKSYYGSVLCISNSLIFSPLLTVTIKNIDIQGGRNAGPYCGLCKSGGGVYATSNTHLILDGDTRIYDNLATIMDAPFPASVVPLPGVGGGIMSEGNVTMRGSSEVFGNISHFNGGVFCRGTLIMEENAQIRNNLCIYSSPAVSVGNAILRDQASISGNDSGGIYYYGVLSMKDSAQIGYNNGTGVSVFHPSSLYSPTAAPLFSLPAGSLICENAARIHHNKGQGVQSGYVQLSGNTSIDSNEGIGLEIKSSKICSKIKDSARIWGNIGGVDARDSLELSGTSSILFNKGSNRVGGILLMGFLHVKDSSVIGFNTIDTDHGAGINLSYSELLVDGGQIIGNRSKWDTLSGNGMGIYMNAVSAKINNARIFNPTGDTIQQNELYIADSFSTFQSDSTWWGDSDTSNIFHFPDPAKFNLNSWVKANWSLNGGLPVSGISTVPIEAAFTLNTSSALPPGMFWMLAGRFICDSGTYSPPISFMSPVNVISSLYTAPFTTRYNKVLGIVDADTFITNATLIGTVNKEYKFLESKISVYPNPSSGILNIESKSPIVGIKIFDIRGLLIRYFERPICNPITLNLPVGVYIMEALYEDASKERKSLTVY